MYSNTFTAENAQWGEMKVSQKVHRFAFYICVFFVISCQEQAGEFTSKFKKIRPFDQPLSSDLVEKPSFPETDRLKRDPIHVDLTSMQNTFAEDGELTIYFGLGKDAYYPKSAVNFKAMLEALFEGQENISTPVLTGESIKFHNLNRNLDVIIEVGKERNTYKTAYKTHDIIMYSGHSRYGRGPAFESYSNYFRMGKNWPKIEVDTRNTYFLDEPILDQTKFSLLENPNILGEDVYQYRGKKVSSSHLGDDAYTILIEGLGKDFLNTEFRGDHQIFLYSSCSNADYWEETVREMFPDPAEVLVFGTQGVTTGSMSPLAVFVYHLTLGEKSTAIILDDMNNSYSCKGCYITY